MKLMLAFALAAVAAAQQPKECPGHSTQTKFPYTDMRSCECDKDYQAYPYPGWGCYHMKEKYACPLHADVRPGVEVATSMQDCKCSEGWAPYEDKAGVWTCVYAYVFHVHGRLWVQPFAASDFGYKEEIDFQK